MHEAIWPPSGLLPILPQRKLESANRRGKGAPVLGKKGKFGDQYVIAKIVPPKKMKADVKKAFEELAEKFPYSPSEE